MFISRRLVIIHIIWIQSSAYGTKDITMLPRLRLSMLPALAVALFLCTSSAHAAKPWQTLAGCRLVEYWANDGNSFRVHWNGGELTVRLYFCDTPESDFRFRERTKAQAAYFGITEEQAVEVGKMAKAFTRDALKGSFQSAHAGKASSGTPGPPGNMGS